MGHFQEIWLTGEQWPCQMAKWSPMIDVSSVILEHVDFKKEGDQALALLAMS